MLIILFLVIHFWGDNPIFVALPQKKITYFGAVFSGKKRILFFGIVVLEFCRLGILAAWPTAEDTLLTVSPFSQTHVWVLTYQCFNYIVRLGCIMHGSVCVVTTIETEGTALCLFCWALAPWADSTKLLPTRSCLLTRRSTFPKSLFLYQWGLVGQSKGLFSSSLIFYWF